MIMESNRQKGFTLIEVLIAMTLLVIGILAVASMQIASLGGNSHAIRVTEATTWAGDEIETIMSLPYAHADLNDDSGGAGTAGLNDTDVAGTLADGGPVARGNFIVFWNVADNIPKADCKTIRILVRRSDKGLMKTVSFDYLKANES
jgi:prepilin-type N-terminal cleavage/methylation domain-containing protein